MSYSPTSFPPVDAPRQRHLRLRVSLAEHAELVAHAEQAERSVSEVARLRMFGRPPDAAPTPLRGHANPFEDQQAPVTFTSGDAA